ncbi:MAG: SDR family NAD(P)-dependent oxidoreductase [Halobacteriales archaeon]|nr:SDR family NAD(P)-dependent oxidoreductase [Halobacteriales archaeon]
MAVRPEVGAGVDDIDLTGRSVLVTGSTSGIGREAALALGRLGADIMVHGRDERAGQAVVADLESLGVSARFQVADFTDPAAVSRLAEAVRAWTDDLDRLLANAGGLFRRGHLTDHGVERTFQVNHLAHFQLTAELLPTFATDARIITTASGAHRGVDADFDGVTTINEYSGFKAYQRSKLANVLFAAELARRFDRTDRSMTAYSLHPGAIPGSGFFRFLPGPLTRLVRALDGLPFLTSVAEGAQTPVYLAAADGLEELSGQYFADCAPRTPSTAARDRAAQRRLWERSVELLDRPDPLAIAEG